MADQQLFTTEEVAELLGLHVRTVRGYVRDGRLQSVRIGRRYRIRREDLQSFVGSPLADLPDPRHRHVGVSSIVEIDAVDPDMADRISSLLMAVRTQAGDKPPLRVETAHDVERARMKIIILGGLADTKQLLEYVQAVLET